MNDQNEFRERFLSTHIKLEKKNKNRNENESNDLNVDLDVFIVLDNFFVRN